MKFTIIQRPSYSALQCLLKNGEEIRAESGAMLAMDATAKIEQPWKAGCEPLLGRAARPLASDEWLPYYLDSLLRHGAPSIAHEPRRRP